MESRVSEGSQKQLGHANSDLPGSRGWGSGEGEEGCRGALKVGFSQDPHFL